MLNLCLTNSSSSFAVALKIWWSNVGSSSPDLSTMLARGSAWTTWRSALIPLTNTCTSCCVVRYLPADRQYPRTSDSTFDEPWINHWTVERIVRLEPHSPHARWSKSNRMHSKRRFREGDPSGISIIPKRSYEELYVGTLGT